jgi:hypothetical protein
MLVATWCIILEPKEKIEFLVFNHSDLYHLARTTVEVQDLESLNSIRAFKVHH